jgi:SulP family sulfate permease
MNLRRQLHDIGSMGKSLWGHARDFLATNQIEPLMLPRHLRGYRQADLKADARAGLNTALLAFPQAMAFAVVAGLPLVYGITCAAVAALVAPLFSSSRHTILGPTNATAFMIFSFFAANPRMEPVEQMPMLVFLVGVLLMMGSLLRVADLAQYISRTVMVAYITGAAVQMMVNQSLPALGVRVGEGMAPRTFLDTLYRLVSELPALNWASLLLTVVSVAGYFGLKRWRPTWPRFAIVLVASSLLGVVLGRLHAPVSTFSEGVFNWGDMIPPFPDFTSWNAAAQFSQMFGVAVAVAFVSMLESNAMAKSLASRANYRVDGNQDMFSLGAANLACAYLSGMPASNSLTRSALNYESGARTPMSSLISGVLCLVGALVLGPYIQYVPKAVLAALVICVALSLINKRQIRVCMRSTKSDALVFVVTFAATLMVPLHVAIFTGIGLSVMLYIRKASQPSLVEYTFNQEGNLAELENQDRQHPSISIVHVEGDLFFGAAELFRTQIQRTCSDPNLRIIILRLKNARHLDATSVMALEELIRVMRSNGRDLIVSGAMKDVYRVLRDSGLIDVLGRDNIFLGSAANPNISTRNALKRAQEILGVKEANVQIYYDPRHQAAKG